MSTTPATPGEPSLSQPPPKAIAPVWHTAGVLLLLVAMGSLSLHQRSADTTIQTHHRVFAYVISMAAEWIIVAFIAWAARFGGASLRTLAGAFAPTWRSILRDLGIACAYLVVAQAVQGVSAAVVGHFIHSDANKVLENLLPRSGLEVAVYLFLALTAGICEETIFRGYLQRQFTAWTGNAAAGIAAQGILFGIAHAYQGAAMVIVIAIYGCMFGALAAWRKSLRPGMTAHFLQDAIGGLVLAKYALK